ncbi:hypothetical protein B0H14DRAFT_2559629 [Mycena olivaceomarginata]|nr:hypothetical protein B0H14DRAFT_2559629 [Mycena olivaceomarginata]
MTQPASQSSKKRPRRSDTVGHCLQKKQEACDYAHVYSDAPVWLPPPKQCRYYLQGNCTNGIWCQYLHGEASAGSDNYSRLKAFGEHSSSKRKQIFKELQLKIRRAADSSANVGVFAAKQLILDMKAVDEFVIDISYDGANAEERVSSFQGLLHKMCPKPCSCLSYIRWKPERFDGILWTVT